MLHRADLHRPAIIVLLRKAADAHRQLAIRPVIAVGERKGCRSADRGAAAGMVLVRKDRNRHVRSNPALWVLGRERSGDRADMETEPLAGREGEVHRLRIGDMVRTADIRIDD